MHRRIRVFAVLGLLVLLSGALAWVHAANRFECQNEDAGCPNWAACEGNLVFPSGCTYMCYWQSGIYVWPAGSANCGGTAQPGGPYHQTP